MTILMIVTLIPFFLHCLCTSASNINTIIATIPNIASWTILFFASHQVAGLVLSRLLAGVSIGLMASNVYIADVASTPNIVFFNYTRQIFITLGAIMMYAVAQIIHKVIYHYDQMIFL